MEETRNNVATLNGEMITDFVFSHEVMGEKFLECQVRVPRLSGAFDTLPVMCSERLISDMDLHKGKTISVIGQFRSHNKVEDEKSKLVLTVFLQSFLDEIPKKPNEIFLSGYICKPPVYHTTPLDREIADVLIAVNRAYNKSDYIPCIAWGRNARFVKNLCVGDKIAVSGRIQSREYQKAISETEFKTMTAYEVSISSLEVE